LGARARRGERLARARVASPSALLVQGDFAEAAFAAPSFDSVIAPAPALARARSPSGLHRECISWNRNRRNFQTGWTRWNS